MVPIRVLDQVYNSKEKVNNNNSNNMYIFDVQAV